MSEISLDDVFEKNAFLVVLEESKNRTKSFQDLCESRLFWGCSKKPIFRVFSIALKGKSYDLTEMKSLRYLRQTGEF